MNEVLLCDPEARWQMYKPTIWWHTPGKWHKAPVLVHIMLVWARRYVSQCLHQVREQLLRLPCPGKLCWLQSLLNYIYISPEIIRGSFSNGLTVGVIPMHLVTRIKRMSSASPWVIHINANKQHKKKNS